MYRFEKIIVVTRRTAVQELSERFGTRAQAKFYIEQSALHAVGGQASAPSFGEYERADAVYQDAVRRLKAALPGTVRVQFLDSAYLPTFTFGPEDLVIVIGPDGLLVNTAKYLDNQPIVGVNPDPATIEGVLLPFVPEAVPRALETVTAGTARMQRLTMAEARLENGQVIRAVNDLFIGQRTHVSARYRIGFSGRSENQSSSGVIVSTGTGSTGWLRSVVTGAVQTHHEVELLADPEEDFPPPEAIDRLYRFDPTAPTLRFAVREPWASKTTGATLVFGEIRERQELEIVSQMPQNGCIFSDGVEADYLPFGSGSVARIGVSDRRVHLVR